MINVSWEDAQSYVRWLSNKTGKSYRLLSESEWEYVARAGSVTAYSWGNEIGHNRANCDGCGSRWDDEKTAPVGAFSANAWGLHDVHGNVWEWVEDCWNASYTGAPADGSAWESGDCSEARVARWLVGQLDRGTSAPRTATGSPPAIGTSSSVSVLPGRLRLESLPLYLLGGARGAEPPWRFCIGFGTDNKS